ncbi:MAG: radical SAM family heme chaperone HemW, partial [Acidimicrobiales bacterium]
MADRQGSVSVRPESRSGEELGVYVHVPFCTRRCDYCAFATWTDRHHLMAAYAAACATEVHRAGLPPATSVFFGGGTPSLMPAGLLASVLDSLELAPGAEVTVECNPDDVTGVGLARYREAGVTRISVGVQSMQPEVLARLGRHHDPGAVVQAVEAVGDAGFGGSFSVDLIFGAAGESVGGWEQTLTAVLALEPTPTHVSAYALTVEAGTPLAAEPARHPDGDDQADKYVLADRVLGSAGLSWYEISSWAKPGSECRHNQLYWTQGSYRGIGCAAHSHGPMAGGRWRRWWNLRTPERYLRAIDQGGSVTAGQEVLGEQEHRLEGLQLALRTPQGVDVSCLAPDPDLDGLVEVSGGRAVLTLRGRLLANEVAL